jgi:GT2 family glycosyltransferase
MSPLKVLTVVINYNNVSNTLECVQSLLDSQVLPQAILVVDNGSSDAVKNEFKKQCMTDLNIIYLEENMGYAYAVNIGLQQAITQNYHYTFILNNDIVINQSTIPELLKSFQASDNIGVAGPVNYFYKQNKICFSGGAFDFNKGLTPHSHDLPKNYRFCEFITASAVMIDNNILAKTGFFDPTYFLYFEDADFCQKVIQHGFQLVVSPSSTVEHKVSKSASENLFIYYYCQRNRLFFSFKYAPKYKLPIFLFCFSKDLLSFILKGILKPTKHNNFQKLIYSLMGCIDFFLFQRGKKKRLHKDQNE